MMAPLEIRPALSSSYGTVSRHLWFEGGKTHGHLGNLDGLIPSGIELLY